MMKRILEAIKVLRQKISFAELRRILNTPLQRAIHLYLPTFYGWTCNISILKNHGGSIDHAITTGFFETPRGANSHKNNNVQLYG